MIDRSHSRLLLPPPPPPAGTILFLLPTILFTLVSLYTNTQSNQTEGCVSPPRLSCACAATMEVIGEQEIEVPPKTNNPVLIDGKHIQFWSKYCSSMHGLVYV